MFRVTYKTFIANFYWNCWSITSRFITYVDVRNVKPPRLMGMNEPTNRELTLASAPFEPKRLLWVQFTTDKKGEAYL